ncbi:unnamed protein product [Anisakis simplex]|uniref:Inner membrane protein n=1 Tax=Anisakis simplex TaxID=6269 RepID=A0A0M3KJG2_ANISI|nr:unnamed protein product [Anisakis simplex]
MGTYKPWSMLAMYASVTGFIYMETDGFRKDTPLLYAMPLLLLAVLTINLNMRSLTKYLTALSFLLAGASLYQLDRLVLNYTCSLMTLSHTAYLLSFISCLRKLWNGLALALTVYVGALSYYCFADLVYSIPLLIVLLSALLLVLFVSTLVAGSIWQYGSRHTSATQVSHSLLICIILKILTLTVKYPLGHLGYQSVPPFRYCRNLALSPLFSGRFPAVRRISHGHLLLFRNATESFRNASESTTLYN